MKNILRKASLFLAMLVVITIPLSQSVRAEDPGDEISIRVDGLSCPFCAYGLEKKLKRLENAGKIHIDIEKGIAHIQVAEGKKISEKSLKQAVEDAGFSAREITYGVPQK
ncbi:hypothetical protein MNBD_NITROSPIRAE01-442 [hydrothermal vent metagenome]|uniref:HMA domain-containing protein n=1 Tax=hydrothermal vent metagenome TaxID=652676 RepID=A0A3B1CSC5_9ZZZZ